MANERRESGARPPLSAGLLLTIAGLKALLHLTVVGRYGYFRDELYYLASTDHLDWGYVDHPPLSIAVLALVRAWLGDSLPALRLVPILAGAATVFLAGVLAHRLGGGRWAQGLAALGVAASPMLLGTSHFYSMNALELLIWTAGALVLLRALETGRRRDWAAMGVVLGLGLLNKISVLWLGGGLLIALLATGHRRLLLTPGPWIAVLAAGLLFSPYLLWQVRHGWPTLEFMRNATAMKMADSPPLDFLADQILSMNPGGAPVWITGLFFGLFARSARRPGAPDPPGPTSSPGHPGAVFSRIYLSVLGLLLVMGRSRASYLAAAYPMLFALGGVALERFASRPGRAWLGPAVPAGVILGGLILLPFALPVLPVEMFVSYQSALGMEPRTEENQEMGSLPQHYADMFGWENMVDLVAAAYSRLTPEERARCRVFGQNYGEAGAVDVLGRKPGLPRALSGHNSYWMWGPGDVEWDVLIIIGGDREDNAEFFDEIEIVGRTASPWSMPYERGLDVSIARKPRMPIREAWPRLRMFI